MRPFAFPQQPGHDPRLIAPETHVVTPDEGSIAPVQSTVGTTDDPATLWMAHQSPAFAPEPRVTPEVVQSGGSYFRFLDALVPETTIVYEWNRPISPRFLHSFTVYGRGIPSFGRGRERGRRLVQGLWLIGDSDMDNSAVRRSLLPLGADRPSVVAT
jgi:hypothetical protein